MYCYMINIQVQNQLKRNINYVKCIYFIFDDPEFDRMNI